MTGYAYNSVTPFFSKSEHILIVLDQAVYNLDPQYFWLGGGRPEL
jgi:hypothetical protein